jgi:histidinol dehydrogenase
MVSRALDLPAQTEHGCGDEFAVCVTEDATFANAIAEAVRIEILQSSVRSEIEKLPRHAIVIIVTASRAEGSAVVNDIAPEI